MKNYWIEKKCARDMTTTVVVQNQKMRARWTMDAVEDLRAFHNFGCEQTLVEILTQEVVKAIDKEILTSAIRC